MITIAQIQAPPRTGSPIIASSALRYKDIMLKLAGKRLKLAKNMEYSYIYQILMCGGLRANTAIL